MRRLIAGIALLTATACGVNWSKNYPGPVRQPEEIRVSAPQRVDAVTPRLISAFLDQHLVVSSSQGGIVQAKLQRESGLTGDFEITAQAIIIPTDSGSDVRLFADETGYNEYHPNGEVLRIGPSSQGRAGQVWQSLVGVARALQPDTARIRFVASTNPH